MAEAVGWSVSNGDWPSEPVQVSVGDVKAAMGGLDQLLVSDGTMPCPVPHPAGIDAPCTKTIPEGWTADEGHGGGHCWMSRSSVEAFDRGDHYDAHAAIAGLPFSLHRAEDCPGRPECNDWRAR